MRRSVVIVAACGTIAGAILFPSGDLTLLSGRTVSYAAGGYRLLLVAGYVALSLEQYVDVAFARRTCS